MGFQMPFRTILAGAMSAGVSLCSGRCFNCGRLLEKIDVGVCAFCRTDLPRTHEPVCEVCGTPLISEHRRCMRCRESSFAFESVRAPFVYRGRTAELVRLYKLRNHPRLARYLAGEMIRLLELYPRNDPLVPVPPRRSRLQTVGWDQVDRLAREVSRATGRPLLRILRRRDGASQKTLNLEGRRENLLGRIFCVAPSAPASCILLDDVMTTGATLSVCASVLKEAGALTVRGIVVAID